MGVNIELHIDELVLQGFAPAERALIAVAVERELARLLAERGAPEGWGQGADVVRLDAGSFNLAPSGGADVIGAQVAQAIYGSAAGQP